MSDIAQELFRELCRRYPEVEWFTPTMIADVAGISRQQVCRYCRQLSPHHEGHYRFWRDNVIRTQFFNLHDLTRILRIIQQNRKL